MKEYERTWRWVSVKIRMTLVVHEVKIRTQGKMGIKEKQRV